MAIAYRQLERDSDTTSGVSLISLPTAPLPKSTIIGAFANLGGVRVVDVSQAGAVWRRLTENLGQDAVAVNGLLVGELWAAFNVPFGTSNDISVTFAGGSTDRGLIVAEYTGVGFEFENPADRVVGDTGTTVGPSTGTLDTGSGGAPREDDELWTAVGAVDQNLALSGPAADWSIRTDTFIGSPSVGRIALLEWFQESNNPLSMKVDHASGSNVDWVAVAAAIRGGIQLPFDDQSAPVSSEPVQENEDHAGSAIDLLLEQFKSHDER